MSACRPWVPPSAGTVDTGALDTAADQDTGLGGLHDDSGIGPDTGRLPLTVAGVALESPRLGWPGPSEPGNEPPPAEWFVLLDEARVHDVDTMAFTFVDVPKSVPADWSAGPDFTSGTLWWHLEVLSKPSDAAVSYQMCLFQDSHTSDNHACHSYVHFDGTGTLEGSQPLEDLWQWEVLELERPLLDLMLVVKDADGNPVDTRYGFDGAWAGSPDLSAYYPMEVRYVAVVVAAGGVFPGWSSVL